MCDLADPGLAPRGSTAGLFYLKGALVDGHGRLDEEYLTTLARIFADQHRRGRKVLVHCAWGRNRSGLVTALVVRELLGVSGAEAVKIVQSRRRRALNNETFKAFLDALPAPAAH